MVNFLREIVNIIMTKRTYRKDLKKTDFYAEFQFFFGQLH